jgi:acyl carrier protein
MVPAVIVELAQLPLTPNGKVDRAALPQGIDRVLAAPPVPEAAVPQGDMEQLVADLWLEQLERPVGRSDNFFDIGGHSLLAVSLFRRLQESTGISIALTDVFRYPTVAGFAAYLRSLTDDGASGGPASPTAKAGSARGAMRRQMLARRGGGSQQNEDEGR